MPGAWVLSRETYSSGNYYAQVDQWYVQAPGPISNGVVTVNCGNTGALITLFAFAGAGGVPAGNAFANNAGGTNPIVTYTPQQQNSMLISVFSTSTSTTPTYAPAGAILDVYTNLGGNGDLWAQHYISSSTSLVSFSGNPPTATSWGGQVLEVIPKP